jgi:hypothetical protein
MSRNRRVIFMTGLRQAPTIGRRFMGMPEEDIPDLEYEIARAAIAHRHMLPRTQTIEHRQTRPVKRHMQSFRDLPPVRMGDHQVATRSALFQIFEIADEHFVGGYEIE